MCHTWIGHKWSQKISRRSLRSIARTRYWWRKSCCLFRRRSLCLVKEMFVNVEYRRSPVGKPFLALSSKSSLVEASNDDGGLSRRRFLFGTATSLSLLFVVDEWVESGEVDLRTSSSSSTLLSQNSTADDEVIFALWPSTSRGGGTDDLVVSDAYCCWARRPAAMDVVRGGGTGGVGE